MSVKKFTLWLCKNVPSFFPALHLQERVRGWGKSPVEAVIVTEAETEGIKVLCVFPWPFSLFSWHLQSIWQSSCFSVYRLHSCTSLYTGQSLAGSRGFWIQILVAPLTHRVGLFWCVSSTLGTAIAPKRLCYPASFPPLSLSSFSLDLLGHVSSPELSTFAWRVQS